MDAGKGSDRESAPGHRQWSAEEKLLALGRAEMLNEAELDAFLQRNQLCARRLGQWRDAAIEALSGAEHDDEHAMETTAFRARLPALTKREHQVASCVVTGMTNKQIGRELGIALDTVKVHRGRAMAKLGIRSLARLARLWERAGPDASAVPARVERPIMFRRSGATPGSTDEADPVGPEAKAPVRPAAAS